MATFIDPADALSAGDVVVYACDGQVVVWNGSATFNVYTVDPSGSWVPEDCFTCNAPANAVPLLSGFKFIMGWAQRMAHNRMDG